MGTFHLVNISGISGWAVNGTHFVGSSHWKIPRKSGKSKKVGPFSRLEFPNRISCSKFTQFSKFVPVPGPWSGTATYRGLQPNGTTFYRSEIPPLLPPKFPFFFPKWKVPNIWTYVAQLDPQIKTKLKMAKRIAMVGGIFLEGRRQTLLYSCKWQ